MSDEPENRRIPKQPTGVDWNAGWANGRTAAGLDKVVPTSVAGECQGLSRLEGKELEGLEPTCSRN